VANIKKLPVVLFFIAGPVPTEEEQAQAEALEGVNVKFRNASLVLPGHSPEAFDDVAGLVPEIYEEAKAEQEGTKKPARKSAKSDDGTKEPGKSAAAGWKPNA